MGRLDPDRTTVTEANAVARRMTVRMKVRENSRLNFQSVLSIVTVTDKFNH
jgi:hypothetical protein